MNLLGGRRYGYKAAVFTFFLAGGISAARADTVTIEELTATQFAGIFGSPAPTFNGIPLPASPNNYIFEPNPFAVGSVTYDDQGNGQLFVVGTGSGYDIGTEPDTLLSDTSPYNTNANINITFAIPVSGIGLIAGDAYGSGGDAALFNVTFGDSSVISGIGSDNSLPITGGDTPSYFGIFDVGSLGISQLNFSDTAGTPTLDTVTTTPEPNSLWLLATSILAPGLHSFTRKKRKNGAARLGWGAAPLALMAVFALLAVPSRSFAQPLNCNIAVPNNPLTAAGLATPYLLSPGDPGCSQAAATMAFVQAAIYNPAAHTISVYTPLVADAPPTTPGVPRTPRYAISPVLPTLPPNAVVAIWFGYNTNNLTLTGTAVTNGTCFTGFGQFAGCNTTAFWTAVNADTTLLTNIFNASKGQTGSDGLPCPTSRSFSIVDQDPNDNLPVSFLLTTENPPRTAQNTRANQAKLTTLLGPQGTGWNIEINPSDEAVVDVFIDGALGCTPPTVADLTDVGTTHPSYAVNELFAGLESGQFPSVNSSSIYGTTSGSLIGPGLVAIGDTFTLNPTFTQPLTPSLGYPYQSGDGELAAFDAYVAAMGYTGQTNTQTISGTLTQGAGTAFNRTVQYRAAANQPAPNFTSTVNQDGTVGDASVPTYCKKMFTRTGVGDNSPADLLFNKDAAAFQGFTGPNPPSSLFIFLGDRFGASYDLLGCAAVFGQPNPVNVNNVNNTTPPYYPTVFPPPPSDE